MKKNILTYLFLFSMIVCNAQAVNNYRSLDARNPVIFGGDYIIYKGDTITLGPRAFFIDGQLTDKQTSEYPYVFNTVNKAAEHLTDGTEESPMVLLIAPYVYWIDDPDDPAIRVGQNGSNPFGMIIECEWLRFYGLSDRAENVVLACNRGQTIGSQGNFTMFRFSGQGTSSENITFGNYCNVDLVFPLKPELGREKRATAIVQAQLIFCNGDKIVARNTRFISRLNLCPFLGGKRVLFDQCHFESTDDALNGSAIYLNSTLDFYSGKPFGGTSGTGAILINCDINIFTRGEQYFTKMGGQVAVLDTRFLSETATYLGWKDIPGKQSRCYQNNIQLNGEPYLIGNHDPESTVDMTGKNVLDAYRFVYNDNVIYNTYNLLRGDDDWDPMDIKEIVLAAEKESGKKYTMLPVQLLITPARASIETGKSDIRLVSKVNRFGNFELKGERLIWNVSPEGESFVKLNVSEDGLICDVIPANNGDYEQQVVVTASTPSGLEVASILNVAPSKLPAPEFISIPKIYTGKNGKLSLDYKLDMRFEDHSLVKWYRCKDAGGNNPVEVAVSRLNKPLVEYELTSGDIGYFLMASVQPKHVRCDAGKEEIVVMKKAVRAKDVKVDNKLLYTDFSNVSTKNQPEAIPGFWTLTSFDNNVNGRIVRANTQIDAWYYGEGTAGSAGHVGLLQSGRNARLLFTPVGSEFGDMKLTMTVAPSKTAGQGFSIANLYMDVLVKFDTKTMTGYALRFIRTTKYGNAVDCLFVKYDNGTVTEISKPLSTSCYRTTCNIMVEVKGNKIIARADTPAEYYKVPDRPEVLTEVYMDMEIVQDKSGGFGIEYAGGASSMIKEIKVEWE